MKVDLSADEILLLMEAVEHSTPTCIRSSGKAMRSRLCWGCCKTY